MAWFVYLYVCINSRKYIVFSCTNLVSYVLLKKNIKNRRNLTPKLKLYEKHIQIYIQLCISLANWFVALFVYLYVRNTCFFMYEFCSLCCTLKKILKIEGVWPQSWNFVKSTFKYIYNSGKNMKILVNCRPGVFGVWISGFLAKNVKIHFFKITSQEKFKW